MHAPVGVFAHIITLTGLLNTFQLSNVLTPSLRGRCVDRWAECEM